MMLSWVQRAEKHYGGGRSAYSVNCLFSVYIVYFIILFNNLGFEGRDSDLFLIFALTFAFSNVFIS